MFSCCICKSEIQDADFLEIHLATEHVQYWAYECEYCEFSKFPSDFALRTHYGSVHKVENFVVKYKVTPELEKKRLELKDLLIQCLAGTGTTSPYMSTNLVSPGKLVPGTITIKRLEKPGTSGPLVKRMKSNTNEVVPVSINISTKPVDNPNRRRTSSLVEIACDSTIMASTLKVKTEEYDKNDIEIIEKDVTGSTTDYQETEETPWTNLFSNNAEDSDLISDQTSLMIREGAKYYRGYDEELKKIYPEIEASKKGDRYFYCTCCRKDVCIGVSGTKGPIRLVQQHFDTLKHKKLSELAKKSDDAVYQALNPKSWGRYRSKFNKMFPEIHPSARGECYFYCSICDRDLVIAQGMNSLQNHLKTVRHLTNAEKKVELAAQEMIAGNDNTTPQRQLELLAAKQEPMDDETIESTFSSYEDAEVSSSTKDLSFTNESLTSQPWVKCEPVIYEDVTVENSLNISMPPTQPLEPGNSEVYLKRPMSAYFKWTQEERPKLRLQYPNLTNQQLSSKLGEIWKAMSDELKKPYFDEMRKIWDEIPNWLYKPARPKGEKANKKWTKKNSGNKIIIQKSNSNVPKPPAPTRNKSPDFQYLTQTMEFPNEIIKEEILDE